MHEPLQQLADEYWDRAMSRHPFAATVFGDHRFDDRVDDLRPEALADERAEAAAFAERAAAISDEELSARERVTRALLVDACEQTIDQIDSHQIELQSDGFTGYPVILLRTASRWEAPDATSAQMQLDRLRALPDALDATTEHWHAGVERGWTPAATIVGRTRAMIEAYLAQPIDDDPFVGLALPEHWDGAAQWRDEARKVVDDVVRPAYLRVAGALAELERTGRDDQHPGLCHLPGGEDLYTSLARRATTTDLSPAEIHEIGMRELTEVLPEQWAEVGRRAVGVEDRAVLFERLRSGPGMKYRSADEILTVAGEAIGRALAAAPDWFERLPEAGCVVEAVPESLAPGSPPAYYGAPPDGSSRPGVYFANTHEPTRRNRFEAEVFAFHEAVPGHHLERASAAELDDVPTFQRRGGYMAYSEGWGLYAERLADEMGLYSSDTMRLGMLSADAWRSARLVLDTGIHAMGWTRDRAIEFMVAHVPLDPAEVAVEVDRYIGMPGQALSYKVGQRELFRLRADAQDRLGDRFDIKGFHHAVLQYGAVPLRLLATLVEEWAEGDDGGARL